MVPEYLTGAHGLCLAFSGAFKLKEEEETWSSAARGCAPKSRSLGLTALLHSELILGCQNPLIYLLKPQVAAILSCKMTCGSWWQRLLAFAPRLLLGRLLGAGSSIRQLSQPHFPTLHTHN